MKIAGVVFADFATSFPGGPAVLGQRLGRRTILEHTLDRFLHIEGLDTRCLAVQPRDEAAARAAVDALGAAARISVAAIDDGRRLRRELIRAARKWSMTAWRGGLLGTTYFDEYVEPRAVARVIHHLQCDAILCLDGAMPALDPGLASAMLTQQRECEAEAPFVFTQAPPGVAGIVLQRELAADCAQHELPVGMRLSYRPEFPNGDPINRPPCLSLPPAVARCRARLTGDTRVSRELLAAAFAAVGDTCDARTLCEWLRTQSAPGTDELPVEVEIELTTDDPLPETTLRPRGGRVARRAVESVAEIARVGRELGTLDDRLVVLGGHGDPLRHPAFGEICRELKGAGVYGLAVVTPLVELTDEQIDALREARVDVLHVLLDADTRETYERVQRRDAFETVIANIGRLDEMRRRLTSVWPLIVPNLIRCAATLNELEAFYDRWIRAVGWATIGGYSRVGGMLPPDGLLSLTPPIRTGCRRLSGRLMLLADGTAAACSEDPAGGLRIGDWRRESLRSIWSGRQRSMLREQHLAPRTGALPQLCKVCEEWHRE